MIRNYYPSFFKLTWPKGSCELLSSLCVVVIVVVVVHVCKLFIFFSETTEEIWTNLGRNVHWEVLYQIFYFGEDQKSNMAARDNNVF